MKQRTIEVAGRSLRVEVLTEEDPDLVAGGVATLLDEAIELHGVDVVLAQSPIPVYLGDGELDARIVVL